jgi:large subunit ribosomal protein L18
MSRATRGQMRQRRHQRVRKTVVGTPQRPRLNIFRSLSHIYAQVVDDASGQTLASASTLDKELRDAVQGINKSDQAGRVGKMIAERALAKGIRKVVFDRGGYRYHGRVKKLAEAAREAGLEF